MSYTYADQAPRKTTRIFHDVVIAVAVAVIAAPLFLAALA